MQESQKSPRAKTKIESKEEKIETLKQTAKSESSQNEAKLKKRRNNNQTWHLSKKRVQPNERTAAD